MKASFKLVAVLLVAFALFIGYGFYREPKAEAQARDFCSAVKVGDSGEGIPERAIQAGAEPAFAKWKEQTNKGRTLNAVFVGVPPFSRHVCTVTATERVISATYGYLD